MPLLFARVRSCVDSIDAAAVIRSLIIIVPFFPAPFYLLFSFDFRKPLRTGVRTLEGFRRPWPFHFLRPERNYQKNQSIHHQDLHYFVFMRTNEPCRCLYSECVCFGKRRNTRVAFQSLDRTNGLRAPAAGAALVSYMCV